MLGWIHMQWTTINLKRSSTKSESKMKWGCLGEGGTNKPLLEGLRELERNPNSLNGWCFDMMWDKGISI